MPPTVVLPDPDRSSGTKIYLALRSAIISNQFAPGDSLVEQKLADLYQVSRTPVREALQRLAKDGLVEMIPRRGAFVARFSLEDAVEIFRMREALEGMAARLAATAIPDTEIERLQQSLTDAASMPEGPRLRAMYDAGGPVHDAVLVYSRSPRMQEAVDSLVSQITRLRALAVTAPGRAEQSYHQHLAILAALRSRNQYRSEHTMREHIASTLETITQVIMGGAH